MTDCTALRPDGSFCDTVGIPGAPFPICVKHAARLYEFLREQVRTVEGDVDQLVATAHAVRERRHSARPRATRSRDLVVYYVQIGDLLKIGSTVDLAMRLASYPPNRRLLATERGTPALEGRRLVEFREYLDLGKEWFRPGPRLLAHVDELRRSQGFPPVRWEALANVR